MKNSGPVNIKVSYRTTFSASGSLLVVLGRDLVVWDVAKRTKRYRVHPLSHPSQCDIHPQEDRIVVKSTSGKIAVVDTQSGAVHNLFQQSRTGEGSNILYSYCGAYVIDGSWAGELLVRCATTGAIEKRFDFAGEMLTQVARTSSGSQWFVVHQPKAKTQIDPCDPAYVSIWTWPLTKPVRILRFGDWRIEKLAIAPDGKHACIVGEGKVGIVSLADGGILASAEYRSERIFRTAAWSPDGGEISLVHASKIVVLDASTLAARQTIDLQYASDVSYSPDGRLLALGSWEAGKLIERSID